MTATPPEPPDGTEVPPPPVTVDVGGTCPRCGTPYEPFQEYCLECGLRLPVARGVVGYLSHAWRRRIPWYPGDWIWPVLLGLVIAALGATFAILATRDDDSSATRTQVATTQETVPADTGFTDTEPTGTGVEPPPADTSTEPVEPVPPPPPTGAGGVVEWPAGQNGWTVVLASVPESAGRGGAVRAAQNASNQGLTDTGVLNSSEFASLHPGYWVVFSGIYNSRAEAQSAVDTARSSYPQAYVREITQ